MLVSNQTNNQKILIKNFIRPLILLVLVIIGIVGWQLYNNHQLENFKSSVFVSKPYNFSINYPGSPKVTDTSQKIGSFELKSASFSSSVDNYKEQFFVYSYIWPPQINFNILTKQKLQASLSQSLNTLVINTLKGTVLSTKQLIFQNRAADQGEFRIKQNAVNTDGYARVFFIKNIQYCIFSLGANQTIFENYANSFNQLKNL